MKQKEMTSKEIRQQFLEFFKDRGHKIVPSAPVVPFDDPTLLFTNAGMNQFKDVFLGTGKRDYKRAADTQKCIRVSGKHNDLEEVGHDTYHHTFFEMLGNWSFGDYYKAEAIEWAWELLTKVWKLPKKRLWATVYNDDDESFELWKSKTDINPKHVLKFGEKDNFWEMGETGPCGPCSEIHINLGDDYDNPKIVNAGLPECIEIWNLVFIQYNKDENGMLLDLPLKHVDTGMGFERVCAILQKKNSNYDTDVFGPLIKKVEELSGEKYNREEDKIPMRVIADHIRTLTFAIADGAVPGNEGRGYVLRRILRRAARYGRKLNLHEPFLFKLVDVLVKTMSDIFPETKEKKDYIKKVIKAEEESFNATLDRGIEEFNVSASASLAQTINDLNEYDAFANYNSNKNDWEIIIKRYGVDVEKKKLKEIDPEFIHKYAGGSVIIPNEDVFKLHDTYGFPVDLTNVMAKEKGLSINEVGFNKLMDDQKERSRKDLTSKRSFLSIDKNQNDEFYIKGIPKTIFTGYNYNQLNIDAKLLKIIPRGDYLGLIFDKSPFYVESGGQVSDEGWIIIKKVQYKVNFVEKIFDVIIHHIENDDVFTDLVGEGLKLKIDIERRWDIMRNHTATHLLQATLRKVIGTHVEQKGSLVDPYKLRFDFTHFSKLTNDEIKVIESHINNIIFSRNNVKREENIDFDEAKKSGALMFFGDKYGEKVNIISIKGSSAEFCGGTHVRNTNDIGIFKIIDESSIASGIRRIEAITGRNVVRYISAQEDRYKNQVQKTALALNENKKLEKKISELKLQDDLTQLDHILSLPSESKRIKIYKGKVHAGNMDELKSFGDEMRNKIKSGVGVLVAQIEDKVGIVAIVSDDLIKEKKLNAGKIVGELAKLVGGGGGGRPHLATAGGKDVSGIKDAIGKVEKVVGSFL